MHRSTTGEAVIDTASPFPNDSKHELSTGSTSRPQASSFPAPLAAAAGALVLLDVLCLGRGDADALAVEPLLTDITADPELAVCIALPTGATKVCLVLLFHVLPATVLLFWVSRLRRLAVRVGLF